MKGHNTGRCPHCNAIFTKPSGCPHMVCALCKKTVRRSRLCSSMLNKWLNATLQFNWSGNYDPG